MTAATAARRKFARRDIPVRGGRVHTPESITGWRVAHRAGTAGFYVLDTTAIVMHTPQIRVNGSREQSGERRPTPETTGTGYRSPSRRPSCPVSTRIGGSALYRHLVTCRDSPVRTHLYAVEAHGSPGSDVPKSAIGRERDTRIRTLARRVSKNPYARRYAPYAQ